MEIIKIHPYFKSNELDILKSTEYKLYESFLNGILELEFDIDYIFYHQFHNNPIIIDILNSNENFYNKLYRNKIFSLAQSEKQPNFRFSNYYI